MATKFINSYWQKHYKLVTTSSCLLSICAIGYFTDTIHKKILCEIKEESNKNNTEQLDKRNVKKFIKQYKEEFGLPGLVVGVSRNNKVIYSRGFGYSDVENNLKAHSNTVMRIASISKPITCAIAAKLIELKKLDIDKPINEYVDNLPSFKYKNKEYTITTRQLMCHTSGIRHYREEEKDKEEQTEKKSNGSGDTKYDEFFLNKNFKTTKDSLNLFIDDELVNEPGKAYLYSTFAYTLLAAVLEGASKEKSFTNLLSDLFKEFDMHETYLDQNDPIIRNRSKYYMRNEKKRLVNVPYVDNSYKWAGGGILSTVNDLMKFGNKTLYFYQSNDNENNFLKSDTIKNLQWTHQSTPERPKGQEREFLCELNETVVYGLGWNVCFDKDHKIKYAYHTGGAVGAVSCLMIIPDQNAVAGDEKIPKGLVIAVLVNSQSVSEIVKFTLKVAEFFR